LISRFCTLAWAVCVGVALFSASLKAANVPASQPADPATETKAVSEKQTVADADRDWFVPTKAQSTKRGRELPGYVRKLTLPGVAGEEAEDWLLFGLEHRSRYERRDDNYRTALGKDNQIMMRSRAYLGVQKILDPLRFGIEFQDSRQFHSDFPDNTGVVNENDLLQAFGELYFEDAVDGKPLRIQVGRMSFSYVDRRLRSRNNFRNTTNAFDGFRVHIGEDRSDWEVDVFAVQPVERQVRKFDHGDDERWFYGLVGTWRRWPQIGTLEPYYFILDEDRKDPAREDREIHTFGLHAYGPIAATGFDYDLDGAFQVGESGDRDHRAFMGHAELGYSFKHAWKPRIAFWGNYASGDRTPDDGLSERFDSLFGSSHSFYSFLDLFPLQNMINPAFQIRIKPTKQLQFAAYYRTFWLASDSDRWSRGGRRDVKGRSDDFLGQEIDLMARYTVSERLVFEMGYAHFFPGDFVQNTGPSPDSDLFYFSTTIRF